MFVIALHGTQATSIQFLSDDVKIGCQTLDTSPRYELARRLVEDLMAGSGITTKGEPARFASRVTRWAMSLRVVRSLETENQQARYAVHWFIKLPFLTLIKILKKGLLCEKAIEALRSSRLLEPIVNEMSDMVKDAVQYLGTERLREAVRHFAGLADWVPVLYVDKHDDICMEYLRYYQSLPSKSASAPACSSRLLERYARYATLMPSVDLVVSCRERRPHALRQWFSDPELMALQPQPYRLLGSHPPGWVHHGLEAVDNVQIVYGRVPDEASVGVVMAGFVAVPAQYYLYDYGNQSNTNQQFPQQFNIQEEFPPSCGHQYPVQAVSVQMGNISLQDDAPFSSCMGVSAVFISVVPGQQFYPSIYPPQRCPGLHGHGIVSIKQ